MFLFTHPIMVLLTRTRYFGNGARHSGLDPEALDAVPLYRGAGRLRSPEDGDGLTIAERRRRAAQQASAAPSSTAGAHGNASVGSTAATARPDSEETQR